MSKRTKGTVTTVVQRGLGMIILGQQERMKLWRLLTGGEKWWMRKRIVGSVEKGTLGSAYLAQTFVLSVWAKGHFSFRCPKAKCSISGEFGHMSNARPKEKSVDSRNGKYTNEKKDDKPKAKARAYNISRKEAKEQPDVMTGTFLVNDMCASVLFDSGASKSFTATTFTSLLSNIQYITVGKSVNITEAVGNCYIELSCHRFPVKPFLMSLGSFDLVLEMDWLAMFEENIICIEVSPLLHVKFGIISVFSSRKLSSQVEHGNVSRVRVGDGMREREGEREGRGNNCLLRCHGGSALQPRRQHLTGRDDDGRATMILCHTRTFNLTLLAQDNDSGRSPCNATRSTSYIEDYRCSISQGLETWKGLDGFLKSGLQFSVGRIRCCLKNGRYAKRVEIGVPVYLAAIFEYLVVEMIAGCSGTRVLPLIMLSKYTWLNSQMQPEGMNRAITTQLVAMYRDNYLVKRLQA
ncbi:hypothetical protein E3N88_25840 [Mikania micrantha]|uniref:Reverse transcriptase domain-containing protein n=1 Tax=Mikania micrantha TaxID=192012 RepID=A0A5N6N8M2_9ASTR|nr:hypothetical protein E3N88_25840 [Mikania micrantha]